MSWTDLITSAPFYPFSCSPSSLSPHFYLAFTTSSQINNSSLITYPQLIPALPYWYPNLVFLGNLSFMWYHWQGYPGTVAQKNIPSTPFKLPEIQTFIKYLLLYLLQDPVLHSALWIFCLLLTLSYSAIYHAMSHHLSMSWSLSLSSGQSPVQGLLIPGAAIILEAHTEAHCLFWYSELLQFILSPVYILRELQQLFPN